MSQLLVPHTYFRGVTPANLITNGRYTTEHGVKRLAHFMNMIQGRRKKCLFTYALRPSDMVPGSNLTMLVFTVRVSPVASRVHATLVVVPADDTGTAVTPSFILTASSQDGSGDSASPTLYTNARQTGTSNVPDDYQRIDYVWTDLVGGDNYTFTVNRAGANNGRVISVTIWEEQEPQATIDDSDPTADEWVSPSGLATGAEILNRDISDLWTTANTKWKVGPDIFHWSSLHLDALVLTNSSYGNVFDTGVTSWSANAPGFNVYAYRKGTFDSTNVPVKFYVVAQIVTSGTGDIEFRRNGATIASITGITSLSSNIYYTTGNLDSSVSSSEKIDVLARITGGGSLKVFRMGAYENEV